GEQDKVCAFESQLLILTTEIKDLQGQITSGEEELQQVRLKSEDTESSLRESVEQLSEVGNKHFLLWLMQFESQSRTCCRVKLHSS
ncbi:hypothetical protein QZH41_010933, partial [Actinostola sp. cb2023]